MWPLSPPVILQNDMCRSLCQIVRKIRSRTDNLQVNTAVDGLKTVGGGVHGIVFSWSGACLEVMAEVVPVVQFKHVEDTDPDVMVTFHQISIF